MTNSRDVEDGAPAARKGGREILAYAHMPKTGGQLVAMLLRRNFGLRHVYVEGDGPHCVQYAERNLATDMKLCPGLRSISGHALQPWYDYGRFRSRLI